MIARIKRVFTSDDLKGRFAKGGVILTGGAIIENGARLIRNIILTRILVPKYFGLMATIIAVIATFQAFTEVGVRQAIIHNKKGATNEFLNVSWWFSFVRGTFLFIIAILTAPFVCKFYNSPELLIPLRVTYLVLFFNGIVSPRIHVLEKELQYFQWAIILQGSAFLGVLISIITGIYIRNIWPLVLGFTVEYVLICLISYCFVPFKIRFLIDKSSLKELVKFARGMFGLPILTAIFQRIDIFAIGKMLTMSQLGLYSVAQNLAFSPNVVFMKIVRPLLLPLFSQIRDDKKALRKHILNIINIVSKFTIPLIVFSIIFSKQILTIIYGAQYGTVAIPFAIIMVFVAIRLYSTILMQLYFALGRPDLQRNFAIIRVVIGIAIIYPSIKIWGLSGAAFTILISMFILFTLQLLWTTKLIEMELTAFIKCIFNSLVKSTIIILPGLALKYFFIVNNLTIFIIGLVLCFLTWGLAFNSLIRNKLS